MHTSSYIQSEIRLKMNPCLLTINVFKMYHTGARDDSASVQQCGQPSWRRGDPRRPVQRLLACHRVR